MRIVLMNGTTLEFLHKQEVELENVKDHVVAGGDRVTLPAVVRWNRRVFVFVYRENPDTMVYREAQELDLGEGPQRSHGEEG